jgi:hypothetical protein
MKWQFNNLSDTKRFRTFEIKVLPATNHKPTRLKLIDLRNKKSKNFPMSNDTIDYAQMGANFLAEKYGIQVDGMAMTNQFAYLLTENFHTMI